MHPLHAFATTLKRMPAVGQLSSALLTLRCQARSSTCPLPGAPHKPRPARFESLAATLETYPPNARGPGLDSSHRGRHSSWAALQATPRVVAIQRSSSSSHNPRRDANSRPPPPGLSFKAFPEKFPATRSPGSNGPGQVLLWVVARTGSTVPSAATPPETHNPPS